MLRTLIQATLPTGAKYMLRMHNQFAEHRQPYHPAMNLYPSTHPTLYLTEEEYGIQDHLKYGGLLAPISGPYLGVCEPSIVHLHLSP